MRKRGGERERDRVRQSEGEPERETEFVCLFVPICKTVQCTLSATRCNTLNAARTSSWGCAYLCRRQRTAMPVSATRCNTLQGPQCTLNEFVAVRLFAPHCNTLQRTLCATRCNNFDAMRTSSLVCAYLCRTATHYNTLCLQHAARSMQRERVRGGVRICADCNTHSLQHAATRCNTLDATQTSSWVCLCAPHCNPHCNTIYLNRIYLQHTATRHNTHDTTRTSSLECAHGGVCRVFLVTVTGLI